MQRFGVIYLSTNKITGEQYIGQTFASEYLGFAKSTITEAIKRKGKVANKFTLVRVV